MGNMISYEEKGYYQNRYVAFLDILGFKNRINKCGDNDAKELLKIHKAMQRIYKAKTDNESDSILNMKKDGVEITTFSDSIVISYPMEKDNLFTLLLEIIYLQLELAIYDVLLRGGVTVGKLYHDGNVVYGPAMNEAYRLENELALYPRIIVDDTAIAAYKKGVHNDQCDMEDLEELLIRDRDGLYYANILCGTSDIPSKEQYIEWLNNFRMLIIRGLEEKDIKIKAKYQWLKSYYNEFASNNKMMEVI